MSGVKSGVKKPRFILEVHQERNQVGIKSAIHGPRSFQTP